ncbi:MAG: hypothetical protein M1404_01270 [Acidobacteria bacterium]|nr:hypothetical protein [Acidobacteriota bacterium]
MNSRKWRRRIDESEPPEKCDLIDDARTAVQKFIADTENRSNALLSSAICRQPHWRSLKHEFHRLSLVLVIGDAIAQFLVGLIYWPALSLFLIAAAAVGTDVFVAVAVGSAAWAFAMKSHAPARAVRICRDIAGAVGITTVTGFVLLVATKVASGSLVPVLAALFPAALIIVAETMPVCAGLFSTCERILAQPDKLQQQLTEARRFKHWLDGQDGPPGPPLGAPLKRPLVRPSVRPTNGSAGIDEPPGPTPVAGFLASILLVCVLGGPLASRGVAQTRPINARLAAVVTANSFNSVSVANYHKPHLGYSCFVLLDATASVDPVARKRAIELLLQVETLAAFLKTADCRTLEYGIFTDAGIFTAVKSTPVPSPPAPSDCSNPLLRLTPATAFLSGQVGFDEYFRNQARKKCIAREHDGDISYRRELAGIGNTLAAALLDQPFPSARCTDILGVLQLVTSSPRTSLIITDAAENCDAKWAHARINSAGKVIFVLLPSVGHISRTGPAVLGRTKEWSRVIQNFQAVPYTGLSPAVWDQLLH